MCVCTVHVYNGNENLSKEYIEFNMIWEESQMKQCAICYFRIKKIMGK